MAQSLTSAFKNAGRGIAHAFTERNMRIHACVAVLAIALGFIFSIDAASWLAIVICIGVVMALETLNTALEAVVDLSSPDYHELARIAKDCAAGAVLIAAIASVIIACIIFLPKIGALLC